MRKKKQQHIFKLQKRFSARMGWFHKIETEKNISRI